MGVIFLLVFLPYLIFTISRGAHRAAWVLVLFGLFSLHYLLRRLRWPSWYIVVTFFPIVILFNITGVDRQAWFKIFGGSASVDAFVEKSIDRIIEEKSKDDVSDFENNVFSVYLYSEMVSFELGKTYYNNWLIASLPRIIFENKDDYLLELNIAHSNQKKLAGACSGIYIDFYRNFGMVGIVFGCVFFGVICRASWELLNTFLRSGPSYHYILLLYSGMITYFPQLLRDGINSMFSGYFFILTPIAIIILLSNRKNNLLLPKYSRRVVFQHNNKSRKI